MSISEESFPADDLFTEIQLEEDNEKIGILTTATINISSNANSSSSLIGQEENYSSSSMVGQSSSGLSSQDKLSDESKETASSSAKTEHDELKFSQISASYQDLHSKYTKRRYEHVKSKVRESIAEYKAEDRRRKMKKFVHHRSMPETLSGYSSSKNNTENSPTNSNSIDGITQILFEREQEMIQLKTFNAYLQSNLEDKIAQLARLKRNADCMQIELMKSKDKERRAYSNNHSLYNNWYSPRRSLPTLSCQYSTVSISTQTEKSNNESFKSSENPTETRTSLKSASDNNVASFKPSFINLNRDELKIASTSKHLRRRSNSSPKKVLQPNYQSEKPTVSGNNKNSSDSAFETETDMEKLIKDKDEFITFDKHNMKENSMPKHKNKRKKFKTFRKNWKMFIGSCIYCKDNEALKDDYIYTQVPLADSLFEYQ